LSILLSLLVPAHLSKPPNCGGILTPSGLSYCKCGPRICHIIREGGGGNICQLGDGTSNTVTRMLNQIKSVDVTELSLSIIPDTGLRLNMDVDLGISPVPSTTKVMRLSIVADLQVEMNAEENLELVTSACKPTMEEKKSTEERSTPRKSSSSEVDKEINVDKICLEVSKLLLLPNERLISLTTPFPVVPSCQVQYLPLAAPVFSKQGITVSLQTKFQVSGVEIPLPVSPVPFSMPEQASSIPSHLTLAFSEHYYESIFYALETAGAFNMTILVKITPLPWQMASLFQEDLPVILQAVFRSSPRVVLEEGKASVKFFFTIQVGAVSPAFQSFLSINV
ncbi:TENP protein, partial [Alcedo cyanopectus]|nr:TENP protein [Ceyx cyanopectus]